MIKVEKCWVFFNLCSLIFHLMLSPCTSKIQFQKKHFISWSHEMSEVTLTIFYCGELPASLLVSNVQENVSRTLCPSKIDTILKVNLSTKSYLNIHKWNIFKKFWFFHIFTSNKIKKSLLKKLKYDFSKNCLSNLVSTLDGQAVFSGSKQWNSDGPMK